MFTHSRDPHPAIKLWCQVLFTKSKTIFQIEMYCMQCFLKSKYIEEELSMIKIGEVLRKLCSLRSCFLVLPPGALAPSGLNVRWSVMWANIGVPSSHVPAEVELLHMRIERHAVERCNTPKFLLRYHGVIMSVSNHQPHGCLLNSLFRRRSKNIKALCHWPLCRQFTGDRWIPRTKGQ